MNFDKNAPGPYNTIAACSNQLLQIDYVANYIQQFRDKIRSGNTEIDWQLAMESLSGQSDSQKLILRKKNPSGPAGPNTMSTELNPENIVSESIDNGGSPSGSVGLANDSVASVAILPSTSSDPRAVQLDVSKRHADQLESQPNPKRTKACETGNPTSSSSIRVDITFDNNGKREERTFKLATDLRGAKITIEFP